MKKISSDMGKHVVRGIGFTIPLIVLYSVLNAIVGAGYLSLGFELSDYIFYVLVPILTAFIASSITPKITFVPGLILGYFIASWQLGYIGGILGGLLLGYLLRCVCLKIKIKNEVFEVVFGYIILGAVGFFVSYFVILFMAKPGILLILDNVYNLIDQISLEQTVLLVFVLSLFTVIDLGGPFNKVAFGFIIEFYSLGYTHIIGPVVLSVFLPPLGVYLGLKLLRNRFSEEDQKSKRIALIGGLFGMTEGALAVGYRRPLSVLPILVIGSALASTLAAILKLENSSLLTSVLGLLTVNNIFVYLLCTVVGLSIILGLFIIILPRKNTEVKV